MHLQPSSRQGELIALARRLACERFAPRADSHDRAASFPFDDYADLRAEGLLGLCVPERYGGLGAEGRSRRNLHGGNGFVKETSGGGRR
jgi:alkylation response protein AidB-like acyl-CoA dehydrogenase